MNLNEAKEILNNNGYFLKEDARRNNTDMSDIFSLIDVHDWSPKSVAEEIMKHYYEPITVDYIDDTNYEDYIGKYVNVKENVDLSTLGLKKLPIRFGTVGNNFNCSYNKLTSLKGAPKSVGGNFVCEDNKLTSLKDAPKVVGGNFECGLNKLTSLKGAPNEVGGDFSCYYNELTSLEGAPKVVGRSFLCYHSELTSLKGAPNEVGGDFYCGYNKLTSLKGAPNEVGGNFYCFDNEVEFTEDDVLKVSNVKGKIKLN